MDATTPMKPTVGRNVYYKSRGSADGIYPPQDFAAIITNVHTAETTTLDNQFEVSLVTFSESGIRFEKNVPQGQEPGMWDWMPFQKDQQMRAGYATASVSNSSNSGNETEKAQ